MTGRAVAVKVALLALVLGGVTGPIDVAGAATSASASASAPTLRVVGSPFDPDGDARRETVRIELDLAEASRVHLHVRDFDGKRIRTLVDGVDLGVGVHTWMWDGRRADGKRVPYGPYRIIADIDPASGPTVRRRRWLARARRVVYGIRPGAIVVALDPGHGGPAAGAVWRGKHEDDLNLDISRRLEAMLKGAGVGVVMTRRGDRNVSPAGKDITGDRRYSRLDELVARNDVANMARADVHIALHLNASDCHCVRGTEMYTRRAGDWASAGRSLARLVQDEHLRQLRGLPRFRPRDRGVRFHPFKALKVYQGRDMPRPSLQPSILGESLFLDDAKEHAVLTTRAGRTAIAAAYFVGIARFLDKRRHGVHFEVLAAPTRLPAGGEATVRLRLTNTGHSTSRDWRLKARVVKAMRRYDGRPRHGEVRASRRIPDGLRPGESVDITFDGIPMRRKNGTWLIKLDIGLPSGLQLSRRGVVGPQLRVRTVKP